MDAMVLFLLGVLWLLSALFLWVLIVNHTRCNERVFAKNAFIFGEKVQPEFVAFPFIVIFFLKRVRQLELENERLNVRINESEVVEKKERHDLVARYESKVKELRDLIDDALKEKTRVNMEAKSALAERDNLRARVILSVFY